MSKNFLFDESAISIITAIAYVQIFGIRNKYH